MTNLSIDEEINEKLCFTNSREIKVPFESNRAAEIAYNVLRIDSEPKRSAVTKKITLNDSNLLV